MPHDKLYSASEILEMSLPDLPTSKGKLLARAKKEDWYAETRVGLGGIRKVFKIPPLYLPGYVSPGANNPTFRERQDASIAISATQTAMIAVETLPGEQVDPDRLAQAIRSVDTYLLDHKINLSAQRRSEVIVVVYNFLKGNTGQTEVNNLIRLVA